MARASSAFVRVFLSASSAFLSFFRKPKRGNEGAALARRRGPLSSLRLFFNFHFVLKVVVFLFFFFSLVFLAAS